MKRWLATLVTDVRLQYRNGFYLAVAFVVAITAMVVWQLRDLEWAYWIAPLVMGNLVMATFYFIGGLVLLEKDEGTLQAQVVTPLRASEYLAAKLTTLTLLSLAENLTIVTLVMGFHYRLLPLVVGIAAAAVIYVLTGFVAVARYDSVNEYLMPSVLFVLGLCLPYLDYFEIWPSWFMVLHPLQGPMLAMKAAFLPVKSLQLAAGMVSTTCWGVAAFAWSLRAFDRYVVMKQGVP